MHSRGSTLPFCNTLQHTATHCNTLQHTATHCNTLQHTATHCNTLQHTATHCITLQHTATYMPAADGVIVLHRRAQCIAEDLHSRFATQDARLSFPDVSLLSFGTVTHCSALQHTATHCNTLQQSAATRDISHFFSDVYLLSSGTATQHYGTLQFTHYTATESFNRALQHTATRCNTLQHTVAHCSTLQQSVATQDARLSFPGVSLLSFGTAKQ